MRKKLLSKVMLLLAMLVMGASSVWAAEEVFYTLTPAGGSNNSYAGNCDIVISNITWNVTGNAKMLPWRIGGKNISNTDRALYSKTPISDLISKVIVTFGNVSSITVNNAKLLVSTDSKFKTDVNEYPFTVTANSDVEISITATANAYYKFIFNVSVNGKNNKFIEFAKAEFHQ